MTGLAAVECWVFDLDNTLYAGRHGFFEQVSRRITDYVCALLGEEDRAAARALQKRYFLEYGTTLAGLMARHRCDPRAFLAYVHDIDYRPIPPDPALDEALAALPGRKLVFTNGDEAHAGRVMARLGVARHFEAVFDIEAAGFVPKPQPAAYDLLLRRHAIRPRRAAMVEDIARNLKPAKERGMTTVWIGGDFAMGRGDGGGHVDYRAAELTPWLVGVVGSGRWPVDGG